VEAQRRLAEYCNRLQAEIDTRMGAHSVSSEVKLD